MVQALVQGKLGMGGVEIDRAHRAENKVQDRKGVTVCRFLCYRDKQNILQKGTNTLSEAAFHRCF